MSIILMILLLIIFLGLLAVYFMMLCNSHVDRNVRRIQRNRGQVSYIKSLAFFLTPVAQDLIELCTL